VANGSRKWPTTQDYGLRSFLEFVHKDYHGQIDCRGRPRVRDDSRRLGLINRVQAKADCYVGECKSSGRKSVRIRETVAESLKLDHGTDRVLYYREPSKQKPKN
jgi:hypothetical protein